MLESIGMRFVSVVRLPSGVHADGLINSRVGHSQWLRLLRMGLSWWWVYKHQCFLVSLVQRWLTGTARLSSWSSRGSDCLQLGDLGSSWSVRKTCVRELWEVSGSLRRTWTEELCLSLGPCSWWLPNLLCRNSILCPACLILPLPWGFDFLIWHGHPSSPWTCAVITDCCVKLVTTIRPALLFRYCGTAPWALRSLHYIAPPLLPCLPLL